MPSACLEVFRDGEVLALPPTKTFHAIGWDGTLGVPSGPNMMGRGHDTMEAALAEAQRYAERGVPPVSAGEPSRVYRRWAVVETVRQVTVTDSVVSLLP